MKILLKKFMRRAHNRSGFTLVEVMVVGVILGVLMLAFTAYMYQQARQNQAMVEKNTYDQTANSVINAAGQVDTAEASEALTIDQI
jgi:prepilin-type N-terminal cleavage/methylation domain-containing protein